MELALALLSAYLLGGIPFGLVIVRLWKGIDIRTVGSGNVGATNASRAFAGRTQKVVFLAIYLLDFAKGFVPALLAPQFVDGQPLTVAVLAGAAAIAGHCASPYLGFRGGKGVATTTGVVAAIEPIALLVALVVFGIVLKLTRRVFVGSLALGVTLPIAVVGRDPATAFGARLPATIFAAVVAVLLFVTHRSNLRRAFAARADGAAS
jgi:glycerol-3-phosphate acyltransferase PlsY